MNFMPSPNLPYVSGRLDFIALSIYRTPLTATASATNRILSKFTLQRAHVDRRVWAGAYLSP